MGRDWIRLVQFGSGFGSIRSVQITKAEWEIAAAIWFLATREGFYELAEWHLRYAGKHKVLHWITIEHPNGH
jgi:hypothetical protein